MNVIGERLRDIRSRHHLSQGEMALRLGLSDRAYKNYELEKRETPLAVAISICDDFGVDLNWLAGTAQSSVATFERFMETFSAFNEARAAYVEFEARGVSYSESTQAERDRLRAAGQRLETLGGTRAMGAAIRSFSPDDAARTLHAGDELNHFWSHIGGWMA
ncbi:MAG: helix-turn-helix transcriptional regulator [Pseudomonadota bacterium]